MSDSNDQADALIEAALDLPPEQRKAYLDNACGGDAQLRQLAEALLRAHEQFLATSQADGQTVPIRRPVATAGSGVQTGGRIGPYKLLQQIGEGGCGMVWMAEQEQPVRRRVALKVIKLGMDTKEVIARFEAERQALALMDHPNIAKVLDAGATEAGRPYFVMELVRGIKITDYCDQHNLATAERLDLFVQVCRAVQHAHQKGIIHRDIKPSNILVTLNDGVPVPKVIDFGIAKATQGRLTDQTFFTAFEQFIGTPAYMSPEQAEMSALDIDTRSDIYSLGVLLYELLTGKTPFDAKRLLEAGLDEIRRIIREEDPPRPSTRLSTLDAAQQTAIAKCRHSEPPRLIHLVEGDLDWIVMKALEKDRTRRYETANEFAVDIQRYLGNEPVVARPPSSIYRFRKSVRRHWVVFTAGAAVSAAILLGVAVSLWQAVRATRAEREQHHLRAEAEVAGKREAEQRLTAQAEARRADAQAQEVKLTLAASDFSQAIRLIAEDKDHDALAYLVRSLSLNPTNQAAATRLATMLDCRTWNLRISKLRHSDRVSGACFSPDGKLIVTASYDSTARVWDAESGRPLTEPIKHAFAVLSAKFSPDGKRVLTTSDDGTARVWNAQTGQPLTEPLDHAGSLTAAQFSPDGKRVVTASADSTARVWDAENGQPVTRPLKHGHIVVSAQFSPDGERIITASYDRTARVWDALTGQPLAAPIKHAGPVVSAQFSPDGKRIITASGRTARVWDAQSGEPLAQPMKHSAGLNSARFSLDGRLIVTASDDGTARVWDAQSGLPIGEAMKHSAGVKSAQFSPDGRLIVTASDDGTARVWDAQSGVQLAEPMKHSARVKSAQFSPDGRLIVTASDDGTARVWEELGSPPLTEPLKHNGAIHSARFSPDGNRIVTASQDGTARVWDAQTYQPLTPILRHNDMVHAAHFSPDGKWIVTASWDGTARVWDAQNGQPRTGPLKHGGRVVSAQFSSDGKWVVTASADSTARVWDAETGQPLTMPLKHESYVESAQFSPDGKRIVTASQDKTARVWDARSGQPLTQPLKHSAGVKSAQFSPDGKEVVTVCEDHTSWVWDAQRGQPIMEPLKWGALVTSAQLGPDGRWIVIASGDSAQVWDAHAGQPVSEPLKHADMVFSAQFSPDGKQVVTASVDKTARIWDAQSGQPLTEPLKHAGFVWSAQFSPDGERVVTGSFDKTARVWDIAPVARLPPWVLRLAEAFSGEVFGRHAFLEETDVNCAEVVRGVRRMLNEYQSHPDHWVLWGRWLLADPATRTISPFCKMTTSEYLERLIKEPDQKSLDEAEGLARRNPDLWQRISEARKVLDSRKQLDVLRAQAESYARAGEWTNAVADFSRLVELEPTNHEVYHVLSPLLVQAGDFEGYRHHCARMLTRFGATRDPLLAQRVAKDCLILPNSGADLEAVSQLAETALTEGRTNSALPYFQFAKGLAEYRRDRFASAAEWAQKVLAAESKQPSSYRGAEACLLLAMAQQQLKHPEEARAALAKGTEIIEAKQPRLESGDLGRYWNDWIISHALLREAKELIEHQAKPAGANRTNKP